MYILRLDLPNNAHIYGSYYMHGAVFLVSDVSKLGDSRERASSLDLLKRRPVYLAPPVNVHTTLHALSAFTLLKRGPRNIHVFTDLFTLTERALPGRAESTDRANLVVLTTV